MPPVETTTAKRRPGPAATNELHLRFNAELMQSLMEMARLAHAELRSYVMELLECGVADFRAKKIPATFMDLDATMPLTAPAADDDVKHHQKISIADREKMISQRSTGMTVREISGRWNIAESTLRRSLSKKKRGLSPEKVQQILFHAGRKYDENDEFLGVQKIAEAVGEPETVVRSVLAAHKPLVSTTAIYGRPPRPRPGGWQRNMVAG